MAGSGAWGADEAFGSGLGELALSEVAVPAITVGGVCRSVVWPPLGAGLLPMRPVHRLVTWAHLLEDRTELFRVS